MLVRSRAHADESGMEPIAPDTPIAEKSADEILAEALAAERAAVDPAALPRAREVASRVAVALVIVVLGYASWATGALIPWLWVIDFGIHEFGHLVTFWAPWRVTAAAGSVLQCAVATPQQKTAVWRVGDVDGHVPR
jgi:hypothetical protein